MTTGAVALFLYLASLAVEASSAESWRTSSYLEAKISSKFPPIPSLAYNLAFRKPAIQSSNLVVSSIANNSVDGTAGEGRFTSISCSATARGNNPWFYVDLLSAQSVGDVKIYNRIETTTIANRIIGAKVYLSNTNTYPPLGNEACTDISFALPLSDPLVTSCSSVSSGRYVWVVLEKANEILNFCEIGVFSNAVDQPSGPYRFPDISYGYGALAPFISAVTHRAHLTGTVPYGTNYDSLVAFHGFSDLQNELITAGTLKFLGGRLINHNFFFTNLAPASSPRTTLPDGPLADAINDQYGGLTSLIAEVNRVGNAVRGSGWVFLGLDKTTLTLRVVSTANHDTTEEIGIITLLAIDVWEHAYFYDYLFSRANYLNNIWNIIDWETVSTRYIDAFA